MPNDIKPLGYQIDNLPGIEYVRVEPDPDSEFTGDVRVLVKLTGHDEPLDYGAARFQEMVMGLTVLLPKVNEMVNAYAMGSEGE